MIRRAALAALVAAALASAATPARAQFARPIGDDRLIALSTRYFDDVWKLDPPLATRAGVHTYDDRLGSYDATAFATRLETARRYLHELGDIDPVVMGADASYDRRILEAALQASIVELGAIEPWKHRPAYYSDVAARASYDLLSRAFAPLPVRVRSLVSRERQIPGLLDSAKENLTTVDATTARLDRREIVGAIAYFTSALPSAVAPLRDAGLRGQFDVANARVVASLDGYLAALDAGVFAHPQGSFAIGPQRFEESLRLQELTPMSLADYERTGEAALAKTRADFVEAAKRVDAKRAPQEVASEIAARHPAGPALLAKAATDLVALRAFVATKDLVTLPPDDDVAIVAAPAYDRETTLAALDAPAPLETAAARASYGVVPVDSAASAQARDAYLSAFGDASFPLAIAHDVMPGRYVDLALAQHERLSLVRKLLPSVSFSEGWGHYVEQMIVDEGWGDGDPSVRVAQLQRALLCESRLLVGLREHTQGLTIDAATAFFETSAYLAPGDARREALRGAVDPLYGYDALGKLELLKLRDDFKRSAGNGYRLKSFHDLLLAHGNPPIAIVRKLVLGAEDDGKLL